jgi:hypothetical protein
MLLYNKRLTGHMQKGKYKCYKLLKYLLTEATYLPCSYLVFYPKFNSCYVSRPATYIIHHFAANVAWQCKRQESTFNFIHFH